MTAWSRRQVRKTTAVKSRVRPPEGEGEDPLPPGGEEEGAAPAPSAPSAEEPESAAPPSLETKTEQEWGRPETFRCLLQARANPYDLKNCLKPKSEAQPLNPKDLKKKIPLREFL